MKCEQPGCEEQGILCSLNDDENTEFYYCASHCYQNGFCYGCGNHFGGMESFDFNNPSHLCPDCRTDSESEEDEGSYYEPPLFFDEEQDA